MWAVSVKTNNAPILHLPYELLEFIFLLIFAEEFAVKDEEDFPSPVRISSKVSHVCRQWRSVALRSSNLWATLCICNDESSLQKVEVFLERSRQRPLRIYFKDDGCSSDLVDPSTAHDVFCLLATQWQRVETLVLSLNSVALTEAVMENLASWPSCPELRVLKIICFQEWQPLYDDITISTFLPFSGITPKLQVLHLKEAPIAWQKLPPQYPLLNEMELQFSPWSDRPDCATFRRILTISPTLEVLKLGDVLPEGEMDVSFMPPHQIHLPSVRYLTLDFMEMEDMAVILHAVQFPELHHLTVPYTDGNCDVLGVQLVQSRILNPLSRLDIGEFWFSDKTIWNDILGSLKNVETIQSEVRTDATTLFQLLGTVVFGADGAPVSYCPKLKQVLVNGDDDDGVKPKDVAQFLSRRSIPPRVSLL